MCQELHPYYEMIYNYETVLENVNLSLNDSYYELMTPLGYLTRDAFALDCGSTAVMLCYVVRDFCPQMTQLCTIDEGYALASVSAQCFLLHCFSISEWLPDLKFLVIFLNSFG
jgi:hypothetical protein